MTTPGVHHGLLLWDSGVHGSVWDSGVQVSGTMAPQRCCLKDKRFPRGGQGKTHTLIWDSSGGAVPYPGASDPA